MPAGACFNLAFGSSILFEGNYRKKIWVTPTNEVIAHALVDTSPAKDPKPRYLKNGTQYYGYTDRGTA